MSFPSRQGSAVLVSIAVTLSVGSCTTPGVNDLRMPPTTEDPYVVPPSDTAVVDIDGASARAFLEQNDLRGLPMAEAGQLVEEAGFAVRFDLGDGLTSTREAPAGARVASQSVETQESYPPSHFVVLVAATVP